ncbi:MAG: molybdate ABC transporter substrate-binding protein [Congregibacter sp.]
MLRPNRVALIYNGGMYRLPAIVLCITLAGITAFKVSAENARPLQIAVAANFRAVAEQLAAEFEEATGINSRVSSASTGVLSAQLRRGAPFDLLLAADLARPEALARDGFSHGAAQCYAQGSLVLLGAQSLDEAQNSVGRRIAIANPRSAPYGKAAMGLLDSDRFPGISRKNIVMGTNVQQALLFFNSGAADFALVARSLSPDKGVPVPREWHAPIDQYAVISASTAQTDSANRFLSFLLGDDAIRTLTAFGYRPCS